MNSTVASSIFDGMPTLDIMASCGTTTSLVLSAVCLVALVVSFCGYRLYKAAIVLLAFVLAAAAEGAVGATWIAQSAEEEVAKKVIVASACVLWGLMAAWVCWRMAGKLNRFLGFALGAVLGALLVAAPLQVFRELVSIVAGQGFAGWEQYARFTLGVPVSLASGFAGRSSVKPLLMLATAVLGAYMAVRSFFTILMCADVNMDVLSKDMVQLLAMLVIAVLGFVTQLFTQPEQAGKTHVTCVAGSNAV
mmetsp:Transcript_907/g.1850  ORF Transcript_907/g.1850 Transcript_907/m.1850 type:complete len:249 (+) Transcript_907:37-783(+)